MGYWVIVDNYKEKILSEHFATKDDAENAINERIREHITNGDNYDYDTFYVETSDVSLSYQDYFDSIGD